MVLEPVRTYVTGDVIVDVQVYEGQERDPRSQLRDGTIHTMTGGGARLLADLLLACQHEYPRAFDRAKKLAVERAAANARRKGATMTEEEKEKALESVTPNFLPLLLADDQRQPKLLTSAPQGLAVRHACGLYRPYPARPAARGCDDCDPVKPEQVWRLREPLGYGARVEPGKFNQQLADDAIANDSSIWVIDDAGLGFRHRESRPAWPALLRGEAGTQPAWVVIKAAVPLAAGDLWQAILSSAADAESPALVERLIVVVAADDLRHSGVALSRSNSWERAALELAKSIHTNPTLIQLKRCRYLVVLFGAEGAVLGDFRDPRRPAFHLLFTAAHVEDEWLSRFHGDVFGKMSCFTAGIVTHLPTGLGTSSADRAIELQSLLDGVCAGLAGVQALMRAGHGTVARDVSPAFPAADVARELFEPTAKFEHVVVPDADEKLTPGIAGSRIWRILEGPPERAAGRADRSLGQARLVAQFGLGTLSQVPYLNLGPLQTVDREEIESLRNIKSLIEHYQRTPRPKQPLSIGVFGQPGAGKSFGVKEIARAVLGPKAPILEFNLSQLSANDDSVLMGAFHQIRDKVLEGHTPVVFWDEFDARHLQWLARLLAPMQDGTFLEGQQQRPIGKCIFVFAGGTCYNFDSFGPPNFAGETLGEMPEKKRQRYEEEMCAFGERKGPDFKSRLTAYLNVAGPNPRKLRNWEKGLYEIDKNDTGYPLRRALLLRAQFGLKPDETLDIEPPLLTALLQIDAYLHGARSMEKLVERIRAGQRGGKVRVAHLPAEQVLDLHVNSRDFRRLLERDVAFQRMAEQIAPFVHWHYLSEAQKAGRPVQENARREFQQLSFDLQQDNVAAARRIPEVLAVAGLELADKALQPVGQDDVEEAVRKRITDQIETLAEAEHNGWLESKLLNDWRYHRVRDDAKKLHDCMQAYRELPDEQQQQDRNQVSRYPDFVAAANFRIQFAQR